MGVDLARFEAGAAKELPERPLALAVGALLPVKGQANLLEAVAGLPRLRLRIVGEGPEREHLQALIRALRLQDRVELAGNLNPDDMPAEYRAADLLALPSYYESQSMALLEGLACGLPVVAAPVGLAPALLADGQAGELAGDNSPASLAGALCRLLARSLEWPQLQQEARRRAADFSLEVCAGRLIKLYQAVLAKRD
jgi:glycosyltransferase involved in cell wall biosynthesis